MSDFSVRELPLFPLPDVVLFPQQLLPLHIFESGAERPELPEFVMGTLLTVLGGKLGIGGLRTYEKQKGLTK